jgi:hypothetical protein
VIDVQSVLLRWLLADRADAALAVEDGVVLLRR